MELIVEREDGVRVIRVRSPAGSEMWRAAFVGAYQSVWSDPPYNERFFPDEAEGVLRRATSIAENITLLAVRDSGVCAGFAMAYPLAARTDVVREVRGLLPIEDTFYFAELGVLEQERARGLGRQLVDLRLHLVDRNRYRYALLRTSATRNASYEMYMHLGFVDTGVYMEVPSRRMDGAVRTDRRLFLSKVL